MGAIFLLQCLYTKAFKNLSSQQLFIVKSIFSSIKTVEKLQFFENYFSIFSPSFYNHLFEAALYKKDLAMTHYLSDKVDLQIEHNMQILKPLHEKLLTNNLKNEDYFSWIAIIASHTTLQLIGLEKQYHYEKHVDFVSFLFHHAKIKQFFNNEKTKSFVLQNCHENAKKMFEALFLDLKLSNKKTLPKVMSSHKLIKI